jgi:Uma2 family endonuclease
MKHFYFPETNGPFRAEQLHSGDPYELSHGHSIYCLPTGGRGSRNMGHAFQVLDTDPDVDSAGVDTGFSPEPNMLRAPDVAVGNVPNTPGWVAGVPPLAVEYADTGQDEKSLAQKIQDLLSHGTQYIWVVRLSGPRLVEVYEPNKPMRRVMPGGILTAPGVLRNPIKVEALYDREVAHEATLNNLLQRYGYESVADIYTKGALEGKAEGITKGKAEGKVEGTATVLKRQIIRRFGKITKWAESRIDKADVAQLEAWADAIFDAKSIKDLLE